MSRKITTTTSTTPESPTPTNVPIVVGAQATILPTYDPYPRWLDHSGLPPAARIVYKAIYYRAISLSIPNKQQYCDHQSRIFVIFSNDDLAKHCAMTLSSIKAAKKLLKSRGYIDIEKISGSNAVRIYPRFPKSAKTYCGKISPKSNATANSSFGEDDFFEASLKKNLPPAAYEAYCNHTPYIGWDSPYIGENSPLHRCLINLRVGRFVTSIIIEIITEIKKCYIASLYI